MIIPNEKELNKLIREFKKNNTVTPELMFYVGAISDNMTYTDTELDLLQCCTKLCLRYLEGRGNYFGLVITKLREDLEKYEGFLINRRMR